MKTRRSAQLALDLFPAPGAYFETFVVGQNEELVAHIEHWSGSNRPGVIYLWGGPGVGKSHLLQATTAAASARGGRAIFVPLKKLADLGSEILEGLDGVDTIAVDDLQHVVGDNAWEQALFS